MRLRQVGRWLQEGSLYVLLFMLPCSKAAIEVAFPFLLIGWVMEHAPLRWRESVWSGGGRRAAVALGAYLAVCALSIATSTYPRLSATGFVCKTLEYALFFVIAADVIRHPRIAKRWLLIISASACLVALDGIFQMMTRRDLFFGHKWSAYGRMTGPYNNPIDLGTYLMVAIPLIIVCWSEASGIGQWAFGALVLLLTGCFINTESRGAWLGLLCGVTVLVAMTRRLRRATLIGCAALLVAAGFVLMAEGRASVAAKLSDIGAHDRVFMWKAAWHMIQDRPFIGLGLNTFMANYLHYWVGGEQMPRYAHNCYLQIWAETGLLGLGAFLWFLWETLAMWYFAIQRLAEGPRRSMLLGLTAGMIGFLVQSACDTNLYSLRQATMFWVFAGLATGLAWLGRVHPSTQPGR